MARHSVDTHRVLVIEADPRVRVALAALINATPGMLVAAAIDSRADLSRIARATGATAAIVDVDAGHPADDLATIHELAHHLPVVAVCDVASGALAVTAGATAFCDKGGDPDRLIAALAMTEPTAGTPAWR